MAQVNFALTPAALPPSTYNIVTHPGELFVFNGVISEAGWSTASMFRALANTIGNSDISGFDEVGINPLTKVVRNTAAVGSAKTITLKNEDAVGAPTASQRIQTPTGADVVVGPQESATLFWDAAEDGGVGRWVIIA